MIIGVPPHYFFGQKKTRVIPETKKELVWLCSTDNSYYEWSAFFGVFLRFQIVLLARSQHNKLVEYLVQAWIKRA